MTREEAGHLIHELLEYAKETHPQEFKAFLMGGIITNVLGMLPEEYWKEFIKAVPCNSVNCDCHVGAAKSAPMLQAMRDDWKRVIAMPKN